MSGGAYEYVMAYLMGSNGETGVWGSVTPTAGGNKNSAGFTEEPAGRYYDAYTSTNNTQACNGGVCYGQALSETKNWWSSGISALSADRPYYVRGGVAALTGAVNNIFHAGRLGGEAASGSLAPASFRSVIVAPGA